MLGRLLGALERSEHARDTIVVFWSDNGWHLGEKKHWHKSTLWQRSTHVPLIMSAPAMREIGKPRLQAVSLLDIYPTLVELCGLPRKLDLEGESLVPLLRDPAAKHRPVVTTYLPGNHAVRTERWRYIRYRDGGEELYDCVKDPGELRNLASEVQSRARIAELARWLPPTSAPPAPDRDAYEFDFGRHVWKPVR
jgi:arylsulfatase A-like enzyme